jgi:hypothetical protein
MSMLSRFLLLWGLLATPLAQAALSANADGTVTDTTTGLVWDQCAYGLSGATCASGTAFYGTWANALAQATAANALNGGVGHKGFNDWRVPNKNELESIVKRDTHSPAIDATVFPNTPTSGYFWTSTTYAPYPAGAWIVDFDNGNTDAYYKTNDFFVRLVRSGQSFSAFDRVGANSYTAPAPVGSSGAGNVTTALAGGGATCALGSVAYQSASSVGAAPPAGVTFAYGVVNFTTTPTCTAGGTITVTLTYPAALAAGTQFYKYGPATVGAAPSWYVHPATIAGNTITYSVTDGGVGDSSPAAGVITDPGGPGVGAGAGGIAGVPTLSQWALLLLAGLLALAAALHTKIGQPPR